LQPRVDRPAAPVERLISLTAGGLERLRAEGLAR
jgi:hypothetical protein